MSPKSRKALDAAILLLLESGHTAKWIAHKLGLGKDAIYRAAPAFFAKPRGGRAKAA